MPMPSKATMNARLKRDLATKAPHPFEGNRVITLLLEEALERINELEKEAADVVDLIVSYGQIDGEHHKLWVLDQAVRGLTGEAYEHTIADACMGEEGPDTYEWDEGIAP